MVARELTKEMAKEMSDNEVVCWFKKVQEENAARQMQSWQCSGQNLLMNLLPDCFAESFRHTRGRN